MRTAPRWLERLFFLVAIVALGWYAIVKVGVAREQAALSNELESARTARGGMETGTAGTTPTRSPTRIVAVPAQSLIGRIEVPRLNLSAVAREGVSSVRS